VRRVPGTTSSWPGREQREPRRSEPGWSVREPITRWLETEGARSDGLRVLDIGCGVKPYRPYFEQAAEYVGVDVQDGPQVDLVGAIESIPVADDAFDVVLCVQVLEHVEDPALAVRELHRVTKPGGRVLACTHGVMVYHPNPGDHWRWTHTGLEKLFASNGDWSLVDVDPGAGTAAGLGMLVCRFVHLLAKQAHAAYLARPFVAAINTAAAGLDARVPALRRKQPGALFANFHVTAEKA
jgi:SAM-dependent methyltransferase